MEENKHDSNFYALHKITIAFRNIKRKRILFMLAVPVWIQE